MKSARTYALLLLTALTLGAGILAWRQYGELIELRAAAMNRDERADLQKRAWDLEKENRTLRELVAAQRAPADAVDLLGSDAEANGNGRPERNSGRGGPRGSRDHFGSGLQQANAIRELMNKPEVQAMVIQQQKAAIEQRYAALFKNLNLQPDQAERLKTLLAERATTTQDVMAAVRDQGMNPGENPDAFRKMIADAQDVINNGIKTAIGDAGFAQLTNYEQTLPQRNVVNDLQQRLSYTGTPLTSTQAEQLVGILAINTPPRIEQLRTSNGFPPPGDPSPTGGRGPDLGGLIVGAIGGGGLGLFGGGATSMAPVTAAAVTQSTSVLTPPQVAALQQIQQQQQTQQQLRQLVNATLTPNPPTNKTGTGTPSSSSTGTGGLPRKR